MDQIFIKVIDSIQLLPDPVSETKEVKSRNQIMLSAKYSCHRHNRLEFISKNICLNCIFCSFQSQKNVPFFVKHTISRQRRQLRIQGISSR
jgi:hypothetical protein